MHPNLAQYVFEWRMLLLVQVYGEQIVSLNDTTNKVVGPVSIVVTVRDGVTDKPCELRYACASMMPWCWSSARCRWVQTDHVALCQHCSSWCGAVLPEFIARVSYCTLNCLVWLGSVAQTLCHSTARAIE